MEHDKFVKPNLPKVHGKDAPLPRTRLTRQNGGGGQWESAAKSEDSQGAPGISSSYRTIQDL